MLIKGFLSPQEQQALVDTTRRLGVGPGGFYRPSYGNRGKQQLFMMNLGWWVGFRSRCGRGAGGAGPYLPPSHSATPATARHTRARPRANMPTEAKAAVCPMLA
eukprot:SAG22_NODE_7598_length_725_cov_1.474441_2_plen_103_part_01